MKKPWYFVMEGKITFFSCSDEEKIKPLPDLNSMWVY
jgi:hypothetical protein